MFRGLCSIHLHTQEIEVLPFNYNTSEAQNQTPNCHFYKVLSLYHFYRIKTKPQNVITSFYSLKTKTSKCHYFPQNQNLKMSLLPSKPKPQNVITSLKTKTSKCHYFPQNQNLKMSLLPSKPKPQNVITSLKTKTSKCHHNDILRFRFRDYRSDIRTELQAHVFHIY